MELFSSLTRKTFHRSYVITDMIHQFFGRSFVIGFVTIVAAFAMSIFSYTFSLSVPILTLIALVMVFVTTKNPVTGLMGVFLELFSNPHGHLIFFDGGPFPISLRMVVFCSFFIGYAMSLIRKRSLPSLSCETLLMFLPLLLAVCIGFLIGFVSRANFSVFLDGNAYLYLLYLIPVLSYRWQERDRLIALQVLSAGALWNIVLSFSILYLFTHFDATILRPSYVFLRDIRLAEITDIGGGFYRVFIQTQFFSIVFGAILFSLFGILKTKKELLLSSGLIGLIIATILLSLSRSFWIGVCATFVVLISLCYSVYKKRVFRLVGWSLLSIVFGVVSIVCVSFFPFPQQRISASDLAAAFSKRTQTDVAISSRWKLLEPMQTAIAEQPLFGHGFGASVSFITDDPRVREISPDGLWSTSSMEWGWLELWLKMGLLGPIGFLLVFGYLSYRLFAFQKTDQAWIGIGLIGGLTFLYVTHAFSPYLNHPIGLGFLVFVLIFLPKKKSVQPTSAWIQVTPDIQKEMPIPASALSLQAEEK